MTNVYRLYREAGLVVRRRRGRQRAVGLRALLTVPQRTNRQWSPDFVANLRGTGRRFCVLTVVDDFTMESLTCVPDTSIKGVRLTAKLDCLIDLHGKPALIVSDSGTETTGYAVLQWPSEREIGRHCTAPSKPTQNALIEAFNSHLRDECFNEQVFHSLVEVARTMEAWRSDYNTNRPHSATRNQTPAAFAAASILAMQQGEELRYPRDSAPRPVAKPAFAGSGGERTQTPVG